MLRVSVTSGLGLGLSFGRSVNRIGFNGALRGCWQSTPIPSGSTRASDHSGSCSQLQPNWRNITTSARTRTHGIILGNEQLSPHLRRWASTATASSTDVHHPSLANPSETPIPTHLREDPLPAPSPPPAVGYWLLSCSALVFAIIIIGGITRLTESGLSITEWKPITGVVWPSSQEQWQEEFEKYSQSPEFKLLVHQRRPLRAMLIRLSEWID